MLQGVIQRASSGDGARHGPCGAGRARARARAAGQRSVPRRRRDGGRRSRAADRVGRPAHREAPARRCGALVPRGDPGGPRLRPAYVGLGRTMAETNPPVARQLAERALTLNASLVSAHVFAGRTGAERSRHRGCRRRRSHARSRSTRRASRRARSRRPSRGSKTAPPISTRTSPSALAINPRFGAIYRIAGTHASRHYRFDDAVALTRKGLAIDPDDARAYAELGLHLLRTGDEPAARAALEPRLPRRPLRHRHLQPARAARHARHVRDRAGRPDHDAAPSRRGRGAARARDAAGA